MLSIVVAVAMEGVDFMAEAAEASMAAVVAAFTAAAVFIAEDLAVEVFVGEVIFTVVEDFVAVAPSVAAEGFTGMLAFAVVALIEVRLAPGPAWLIVAE